MKLYQHIIQESRSSGSSSSSSRSKREEEDPLIGETFKSRYTTKNLLGKGAFGRVFLVYDEKEKTEYFIQISHY